MPSLNKKPASCEAGFPFCVSLELSRPSFRGADGHGHRDHRHGAGRDRHDRCVRGADLRPAPLRPGCRSSRWPKRTPSPPDAAPIRPARPPAGESPPRGCPGSGGAGSVIGPDFVTVGVPETLPAAGSDFGGQGRRLRMGGRQLLQRLGLGRAGGAQEWQGDRGDYGLDQETAAGGNLAQMPGKITCAVRPARPITALPRQYWRKG